MAQRASKKSADPAANHTSAQVIRDLHERMVRIRLFETEAGKAHGGRQTARASCTSTSARKPWPPA